ncbi:Uncharacterised protein [Mycobacterium tuberculosis]|nr:Uncharacterised protein [Mycobacterium tuberculosis]
MPVHRLCAASVWPEPEMSSSSPSTVSRAVPWMSCGRTRSTLPSGDLTSQVPLTRSNSWNTVRMVSR